MKVLLKVDVDNLGYAGEVYDVAAGYGRNYLIPQGLAVKATNRVMRQAAVWRQTAEVRRAELKAEHDKLSASISEVTLTFLARAGQSGKLYGSVTTAQIADKLNETLGTEIDRRKVGTEPLRQLGEHKVVVRLSADHVPELTVLVDSEDEAEAAAEESVELDAVDGEEPNDADALQDEAGKADDASLDGEEDAEVETE
jgi:large subunit ribosomal protein L9